MSVHARGGLSLGVYPGLEPRLLVSHDGGREDRRAYELGGGYAAGGADGEALIEAIESAGLRGRGGAAFPTGVKLRSVADREGPRYLIANGEEGEPAAVKDRWLLRMRPHLVLDGTLRAARAIGAERAYVYLSDAGAAVSVRAALAELGDTDVPLEVVQVDPGYVAGEETSAVRAIGGGPALPLDKPPRPFEAGVAGRPTLVANVETLANVPRIAVGGPDAFRDVGMHGSPGTFLLTLSGAVRRPGLYELPLGVPLGEAVERCGGFDGEPRGFLMGGFFGGVLPPVTAAMPLAYDPLREEGSGLGCGAVIVLGPDDCPVWAAGEVMGYFARENAHQCGACMRGTDSMRDVLFALGAGSVDPERVEKLRGWSMSLRGRGACGTLDGAATVAASLLRGFPAEVERHLEAGCAQCAAKPPTAEDAGTTFALTLDDMVTR